MGGGNIGWIQKWKEIIDFCFFSCMFGKKDRKLESLEWYKLNYYYVFIVVWNDWGN